MIPIVVFGRITIDISDIISLEFAPINEKTDKLTASVYIERRWSKGAINPIHFDTNEEAMMFYNRIKDEWLGYVQRMR
jgi:hypothetical protein